MEECVAERVIVHIDMDAFFAAIEQRDRPECRNKPVIVGADPKGGRGRGVVSTCSYEARVYGVHSAMPISLAFRRCPRGVFLPVRMEAYAAESRRIRTVLEEFTPLIEPVSIDEAFLDVSGSLHLFGSKGDLARLIQERIAQETKLSVSVGIAPVKMVAKMASDIRKPAGIVIVEPAEVEAFLRPLPVKRLWGVGEKSRLELGRLGIGTIGDLADYDVGELVRRFGQHGAHISELARGRDDRPVSPDEESKSIGAENTFEFDTDDPQRIQSTLMGLCEEVAHRLRDDRKRGRTVTTKVRLEGFITLTRAQTLPDRTDTAREIYRVAWENFLRAEPEGKKIRLLGVSVSGFEGGDLRQGGLFDAPRQRLPAQKQRSLDAAVDRARARFGDGALRHARSLPPPESPKRDRS